MRILPLFSLSLLLVLNSCKEDPVDVVLKSSISIDKPLQNSSISDSTTIMISVSSQNEIIRVELFIDHELAALFEEPPYEYQWVVKYYNDGSQHIIDAAAYDEEGNTIKSKPVIVNVYRFMPAYLRAILNSDTTISLEWADNCSFETGFEIEQAINDSVFTKIANTDSNVTSFTVIGNFNKSDKYYFRVRAESEKLFSGYSNVALAHLLLNEPVIISLDFDSDTSAVINWKDNNSFETSYIIQQKQLNSYITIKELPANSTLSQIPGLFYNYESYEYRIAAAADSAKSFSVPIIRQFIFNAPLNLSIEHVSTDKLNLRWENGNEFNTAFKIEKAAEDELLQEISTTPSGQLNFVDSNVDTSKRYKYRVKAVTKINTSYPSSIVHAASLPYISLNRKIRAPSPIASFDINEEENLIVMGGYTNPGVANFLINSNTGSLIKTLYPADSLDHIFEQIGFSYNEAVIAASGYDKYITLWNASDASIKGRLYTGGYVTFLLFHPSEPILFAAAGGNVYWWNYETGSLLHTINGNSTVFSLALNTEGNNLAIGGSNENIKIVDINSGTILRTIPSSDLKYDLIFLDDNNLIFHGINNFGIMDINSGASTLYSANYGCVDNLRLHPNKKYLLAFCTGGIHIFNLFKQETENVVTGIPVQGLRFINGGDELMSYEIRDFSIWNFGYKWEALHE